MKRKIDVDALVDAVTSGVKNELLREMYTEAVRRYSRGDPLLFEFMKHLERPPVHIREFLESKEFMGATDLDMWPAVKDALIDINENWWRGVDYGAYEEAVLGGATGTAKSSIMMVSTIYHLYLLTCLKKPQKVYGLPSAVSIVFPVMGAKPNVVNKVVYATMRRFIESMPYFQKYAPMNKYVESEILLEEKNIRVIKAGGDEDALLGEAIIGSLVDEINFMQVVQRSKKAEVGTGKAGLYDQAEVLYNRLLSRKRGRFQRPGSHPMIGINFASSSTRYKGDFTDRRIDFVRRHNIKSTYVYVRKQYEVVPQERFSGEKFRLLIGNDVQHDTRVLADDEKVVEGARVELVPIEYKSEFMKNPFDNLRDVLGIAHNAVSPFIKQRHKVYESAQMWLEEGYQSILEKDHVVLGIDEFLMVRPGVYCANPSRPRYIHIDLSVNEDELGIAMVRFDGLIQVEKQGVAELMPRGVVEMAATIKPDASNEIDIAEVRAFAMRLKTMYGYPIKGVSYDGFNSRESIQAWRKSGIRASQISLDRTDTPYKQFRDAVYDGRLLLPYDEFVLKQICDLEHDVAQGKVDHPVHGDKGVSDAICGAYTNMLERKSTWAGDASDIGVDGRWDGGERYDSPRRF